MTPEEARYHLGECQAPEGLCIGCYVAQHMNQARTEALEEAARVADSFAEDEFQPGSYAAQNIAAAIRALK